jgi:hypothetical protein
MPLVVSGSKQLGDIVGLAGRGECSIPILLLRAPARCATAPALVARPNHPYCLPHSLCTRYATQNYAQGVFLFFMFSHSSRRGRAL